MLVVIPTYRRIATLKWVLQSLVQCRTESIREPIRVLVVNNHPSASKEITRVVSDFTSEKRFEWSIICREKTLPPVQNWYSAICENALPDEVVFLHGDDDIFCPWSLEDRYEAICSESADVLLSKSADRILFLPDQVSAIFNENMSLKRRADLKTAAIPWINIHEWGAVFIGNNSYRYTEKWKRALSVSFEWCHRQDWLDWNTRTLMLPFYLPFAIKQLEGTLVGLDQVCVIRGGDFIEIRDSAYGSPGWNGGFLSLCAYGVLTSAPLACFKELDAARRDLMMTAAKWLPTFYHDSRIPSGMRKETLRRIGIPHTKECALQVVMGFRLLLGEMLNLRGWKWSLQTRHHARPLQEILQFPPLPDNT